MILDTSGVTVHDSNQAPIHNIVVNEDVTQGRFIYIHLNGAKLLANYYSSMAASACYLALASAPSGSVVPAVWLLAPGQRAVLTVSTLMSPNHWCVGTNGRLITPDSIGSGKWKAYKLRSYSGYQLRGIVGASNPPILV